nr:hypothetical protein [Paraburkholderia kirstenboschensis]
MKWRPHEPVLVVLGIGVVERLMGGGEALERFSALKTEDAWCGRVVDILARMGDGQRLVGRHTANSGNDIDHAVVKVDVHGRRSSCTMNHNNSIGKRASGR